MANPKYISPKKPIWRNVTIKLDNVQALQKRYPMANDSLKLDMQVLEINNPLFAAVVFYSPTLDRWYGTGKTRFYAGNEVNEFLMFHNSRSVIKRQITLIHTKALNTLTELFTTEEVTLEDVVIEPTIAVSTKPPIPEGW